MTLRSLSSFSKKAISEESLEVLRFRILTEMTESPLLDKESCEFLIQTYTKKLEELHH